MHHVLPNMGLQTTRQLPSFRLPWKECILRSYFDMEAQFR
ncbi:unnamed protein product, partial [Larinioides sclopetarius]